jgi:hypothetical protein
MRKSDLQWSHIFKRYGCFNWHGEIVVRTNDRFFGLWQNGLLSSGLSLDQLSQPSSDLGSTDIKMGDPLGVELETLRITSLISKSKKPRSNQRSRAFFKMG